MTAKKNLLALGLLICAMTLCNASIPYGLLTFSVTDPDLAIWDFSGDIGMEQTMTGAGGTAAPVGFGINLTTTATGKLTGLGDGVFLTIGNDSVAASYTAKGNIYRSGSQTRAKLQVKLKGEDVIGGVLTPFTVTINYNDLALNAEGNGFGGNARGSVHASKLGSAPIDSEVFIPLPGSQDGTWQAQVNVVPFSHLSGSATVVLSNGRALQTNLKGSVSPTQIHVQLSGVGLDKGTSVDIRATGDEAGNLTTTKLKAKILGQSVQQQTPSD